MTKHSMFRSEFPPKPSKMPIHPIWRGIGLVMLVVLPIGSYLLASILIESKERFSWVIIPTDIVLNQYPKDPMILVRLFYALVILIGIAAILAFVTFLLTSLFGPSRYDPLDVPPGRVRK